MRLIDADELMKECAKFVAPSNNSDFADVPTWNDAVSLIGSAPTIEERKTGKWDSNRCSECGFGVLLSPYMHNLDTGEYTLLYKFCPNCGAKMEVDDGGR